jgi:hypothetical protein
MPGIPFGCRGDLRRSRQDQSISGNDAVKLGDRMILKVARPGSRGLVGDSGEK